MVKSTWNREKIIRYSSIIADSVSAAILLFTLTLLVGYWYKKATIFDKIHLRLDHIAYEREKEILGLVDHYKRHLDTIIHKPDFIKAALALSKTYVRGALGDYKGTTPEYKQSEALIDQFLIQNINTISTKDFFLIKRDGTIFYVNKGEMLNANLYEPHLRNSILALSLERVNLTLTPDISEFAVDPLTNEPSLFILAPIIVGHDFIGVAALRLDETNFYTIIRNYSDLGQTGDILLTKSIGDRVLFIAPSRIATNIAFKKIVNPEKDVDVAIHFARLGHTGFGAIKDIFNQQVIAAWRYIPQVDWELIVKINESEAYAPLHKMRSFLLIFCFLSFFVCIYLGREIRHSPLFKRFFSKASLIRLFRLSIYVMFAFSLFASGYFMFKYRKIYQDAFNQTRKLAKAKVHIKAQSIEQNVVQLEKTAAMIAQDLQSNILKKEDIAIRIAREIKGIPNITGIAIAYAPFAFDPNQRLYALHAHYVENTVKVENIIADYMIPGSEQDPESDWYNKTIKRGAFWSDPYINKETQVLEIRYSIPFYKDGTKEYAGVIALTYRLDTIINKVKAVEIGKTGYLLILSPDFKVIHHPLAKYVEDKANFTDVAGGSNNAALNSIIERMNKQEKGYGAYHDKNSGLKYWIVYEPVPSLKWTMAALFSQESLDLPVQLLHKLRIWAFASIVICLLLFLMLIIHLEVFTFVHVRNWTILSAILFSGGLIAFWTITRNTSYQPAPDRTIIRDQTNLDKFTEFLELDANQRNEKRPIPVGTGILLYTLSFPDSARVSVSGYIWQRIKKGADIKPGVRLPEATEVKMEEVVKKEVDGHTVIGWNIKATFLQKYRYSWFPFDRVHIDITLASADFENNVILVPDFSGYQSLEVDPLPGITNRIVIPGFDLDRSFFSFSTIPLFDEVGIETLTRATEKMRLHYNVILERRLTNPFIIYFLPLLVILFAIYAVLLVTVRANGKFDIFSSLSAYTALFFSLLIVHQTLRNQYQAGELLYIEYFFFFTYLTLLFLILHALLLRVSNFAAFINRNISPYLRILYWTLQFGFWFIITMIIFYKLR